MSAVKKVRNTKYEVRNYSRSIVIRNSYFVICNLHLVILQGDLNVQPLYFDC